MIVTFDPAVTGGAYSTANTDAYYVNFLRCVTAIATANAGTTSLTVNPYTATNAVDGTRNCILSIVANTEGGGWLTSNSHSIPSYPSTFIAMASQATFATMYKADFYNASGKAGMPFNKMTFHAVGHNTTGNDSIWNGRIGSAPLTNWNGVSGGHLQMTFGCNDSQGLTGNYTPSWSTVTSNQQTTSFTNNGFYSNVAGQASSDSTAGSYPGGATGFNLNRSSAVTYTMAVTKDYCIIWENVRTHSYLSGYSTGYTALNGSVKLYGSMMYGGFRTTTPWEDTLSNNPPWAAWTIHHTEPGSSGVPVSQVWLDFGNQNLPGIYGASPSGNLPGQFSAHANYYTSPQPPNCASAFLSTINDLGEVSATATRYVNYPTYQYHRNNIFANVCAISGTALGTAAGKTDNWLPITQYSATNTSEWQLGTPLFYHRQKRSNHSQGPAAAGSSITHNPNLPTIDPDTGTFVPGAYPINISRTRTGSWNNGGICKGIYKSLTLPINTMKLYFSDNQTFNVNGEVYMPIVFNEDMYLIRKA
jgi:hypothetical protein